MPNDLFKGWTKKDCSKVAIDFMTKCMSINPSDRPSAEELIKHKWIRDKFIKTEVEDGEIKYLGRNIQKFATYSSF